VTKEIKQQFPALADNKISYLDSASSCQTPETVIEAMSSYLRKGHGNPHRGMYPFAEAAESQLEACREAVANKISAQNSQIVLTKSTTESINAVAAHLEDKLRPGQSILLSEMEHHANILPWQRLSKKLGLKLNYLKLTDNLELDLNNLETLLDDNCGLVAIALTSNLLGTINPVETIIKQAKDRNIPTLIDAAQSIAHDSVDVKQFDCDYLAFSGHKLYGPTGIGVLYLKEPEEMQPFLLGGGIVSRVSLEDYKIVEHISRFEAGSPNMLSIVGLSAALRYMEQFSYAQIQAEEQKLVQSLRKSVENNGFRVISHSNSTSIVSFVHPEIHSHDIATILTDNDVAVRAGHHCAQPCLSALGLKQCVRASVGIYNTSEDIEKFDQGLKKVNQILGQ